jgi:hypothetical protein
LRHDRVLQSHAIRQIVVQGIPRASRLAMQGH